MKTTNVCENKENEQVLIFGNLIIFLKNTNDISDNKEKGQVT